MKVYKEKFLANGNRCIVFVNIKMKQKEKRKKDLEGRHVMVVGSINHS